MNIHLNKKDKYAKNVGLFCNARDEKNIREWAAHHLLIGFDRIIIFDHKSVIPLKQVFAHFDNRVQTIRVELKDGNIKNVLMNCASKIAKQLNLDWFLYLDADEFLIFNTQFKGVKHFLNTYSCADSIGINWLFFGSNYFIQDPSGLILENYTKSSTILDKHVKSFVRTDKVLYSDNPHFYHMKNKSKMLGLGLNTIKSPQCFNELPIPYHISPAYIAHYVFQSEETYLQRKINKMADNGTTRVNMGKDVHNLYNEHVNIQPQKYVPQIKEFLNYYSNHL